eukprot:jgi/Galph1/5851/GphlegSOOS_G4525.1
MKHKKKTTSELGRSLQRTRDPKSKRNERRLQQKEETSQVGNSTISITEPSDLEELLLEAELANRNFEADRHKRVIFDADKELQVASKSVLNNDEEALQIPRRPKWSKSITASQLESLENEAFLEWRRKLAKVEESSHCVLTPFEKNLQIWRQLWRVVEKSDLILQILDARNPLLYYSKDLERYVREVSKQKQTAVVLNKADLLPFHKRREWSEYFSQANISFVFFSAKGPSANKEIEESDVIQDHSGILDLQSKWNNSSLNILSVKELIEFFQSFRVNGNDGKQCLTDDGHPSKAWVIGLVGYPNVGKSSTINALLNAKRTAVSSTPGKTKHFQTLFLDKDLLLCDCPGLVFPNFASSKEELICNGILSIDQLRDPIPPLQYLCKRISKREFEQAYKVQLHSDDAEAREVLEAYAMARGFMTKHGNPDIQRSARLILKDYVNARLVFCESPPFN